MRVLVYDLGGGTFDVTLLEIAGTQFRALATDGDVRLGGKDFDERLVNYLGEQFLGEHGADPRSEPQDAAQLWLDVQEAKHSLSQRSRTSVVVFHAGMRIYAANGRISVAARVPSVRQSAQVEMERQRQRDLGQLATWRTRLGGADAGTAAEFAADSLVDLNDPSSVLRRLDTLHVRIGRAAVTAELPKPLRRSQEAARAAASQLERTHAALQQAQSARHAAADRAEAIRFGSERIRAKAAHDQALTQSDFAHLVLGRECLAKRVHPPGVAKEIQEIERLRTQLE